MRKFCKEVSLAILNPKLTEEWDIGKNHTLQPCDVRIHSHKKVWWRCRNGHGYNVAIDRRSAGEGCPYCSGHRTSNENCLATLDPNLAKEWHPTKNGTLTPKGFTCGSHKKVLWLCKKGHSYVAAINQRSEGRGCPYCVGKKVCRDNCLATLNPQLAKEWNYNKNKKVTPETVTCNSSKTVWWTCKKKHEYLAKISSRNQVGVGCPQCNKIILKDGSLCDSLPEAYYYLELKNKSVNFDYHAKIGMGKHNCDFYIPAENKYIEVTGFSKTWEHWQEYFKNITKKKLHIIKNLKANFEFVQLALLPKQIQYVRENSL